MNDPIASDEYVESLLVRHGALLERVSVLERALEQIADGNIPLGQWGEMSQAMQDFAREALDA